MTALLAVAMFLLAASLAALPLLQNTWQAYVQTTVACAAGGFLTVLFFAVWAQAFGATHVGRIQGAAQMLTVVASAVGPLCIAWSRDAFGSYLPIFMMLAIATALFGVAALRVSLPVASRGDWAPRDVPGPLGCFQES
jgi:hypothetical protein